MRGANHTLRAYKGDFYATHLLDAAGKQIVQQVGSYKVADNVVLQGYRSGDENGQFAEIACQAGPGDVAFSCLDEERMVSLRFFGEVELFNADSQD